MTLEVSVSEVIAVVDVFDAVKRFFARIVSWFAAEDDEAVDQDTGDEEDNKSPPVSEQTPQDIGVNVTDEFKAGESFGP